MKKIKKITLLFFSAMVVALFLQQMFYRVVYEGNLLFCISNESSVDSARLEIIIDGIKVVDSKVENITHLNKRYPITTTLGNHTVVIKMNGETAEEIRLNTLLVTFVNVDYYETWSGDVLGNYGYFHISVRKRPLIFIA